MSDLQGGNEPEQKDVFDEDVSQVVNTIMLMRIYDMLLVIARGMNADEAVEAVKKHRDGKILGPPPSWDMSDDSNVQ